MSHLFICTGEVSGDLQASHLIRELLQQRPQLRITAVGGERMAAAGAHLLHRTTEISSIGVLEALPFIGPALWAEWKIRRFLAQDPPDVAVLVDYIGVNSRIARLLQQRRIPGIYYIAPQEWVWSQDTRITYQLAQQMQLMLAIFPQEARYYKAAGAKVQYVGHPLLDILASVPSRAEARAHLGIPADETVVVLVPASRQQEIRSILPILLKSARLLQERLPQVRFWVPLASPRFAAPIARAARKLGVDLTLLDPQALSCDLGSGSDLPPPHQAHHLALASADLVLAKSGTVNLETAILGIPQVVIYRLNPITFWIARHWLKVSVPFMSPPNLVQMRPIVPELLQDQAQPETLVQMALAFLTDPQRQAQLQADYATMRAALGEAGVLRRAAKAILAMLDAQQGHSDPQPH
ncbi:MAG: lipid-A-disaccharide synthase [Thermostichus sp. BF3_bins_97]